MIDQDSGKAILQFVAIKRRDTKEWAIPGGMRDPNEIINKTLVREFTEEALNLSKDIHFNKFGRIVGKTTDFEQKLNLFFRNGTQVYLDTKYLVKNRIFFKFIFSKSRFTKGM